MIITDEKLLRVNCVDVNLDEIGTIIEALELELRNSARLGMPGIGLAAPQIGIAKKAAIIRIDNFKLNIINCKINNQYDKILFKDEGCLSFPGRVEDTFRYQEIHVINNLVFPNSFILQGLAAIVLQHELDHLNGKLLPDNAIKIQPILVSKNTRGPNDPCYCGKINLITGKVNKFKKCCGRM